MIFPNGRVAEVYLNLARRGALGEYLKLTKHNWLYVYAITAVTRSKILVARVLSSSAADAFP